MSQVTLLIKPIDVVQLTTFNGNIDEDTLNPIIFSAQTAYLKSFLGVKLYTKIYTDFDNDSLSGNYLYIYENYIKDILSLRSAALFVEFGNYKVSENGIHKVTGENMETLEESDISRLVSRYTELLANMEGNFKEYVEPLKLPELASKEINTETNHPWL